MGSLRVTRWAGIRQAVTAVTASTRVIAAHVMGSLGMMPACDQARQPQCHGESDCRPGTRSVEVRPSTSEI